MHNFIVYKYKSHRPLASRKGRHPCPSPYRGLTRAVAQESPHVTSGSTGARIEHLGATADPRKHPYGWVVAGYSCGHTVDSPGCIVAGTLGRRDALPVARESPPCAPAAFHGLLAGYVLRRGRPTKTSHKIPRAARRAPRVSHIVRPPRRLVPRKESRRARFERARGPGTDIPLSHTTHSLSLECPSNRIRPPRLRLATHNARGPLTFGGEFGDGTSDGVRKESRRARFKRAQGRSDT